MQSIAARVGIDVSKDWLDVCQEGQNPFRIRNTKEALSELAAGLPRPAIVGLEPSGGYEKLTIRQLEKAGVDVRMLDAYRARRLAQGLGIQAKTDPIDARILFVALTKMDGEPAKSPEREELTDLSRTADSLKAHAAGLKKQAGRPGLIAEARDALLASATTLGEQAQALERKFEEVVLASSFAERYKLALTVPGVGPCLARTLVCELPEDLSNYTTAQLCAYAGVAPMDNQSGKRTGKPRVKRGNSRLKAALYMPARSLLSSQAWAKELSARLRSKGLAFQQIAVALMRRLLTRALSVMKRGTPWQENAPQPLT